jgi:hypothetical protein
MRLQVVGILENGASKILPISADTLRVLLILPDSAGPPSPGETNGRGPGVARARRRVMASLATGVA